MSKTNTLPGNDYPFLKGGGEMGELIRSVNWAATALGSPDKWPGALKQTVSMMLTTNFPVLICWGKDYTQLYNDSFRPINGVTKHPKAMGGSAKDTYAEIWETIGPMFAEVMGGKTIGFPDFMVPLDRNGYLEDCYFDFSYSPIYMEDGQAGGVLVVCAETTDRVNSIRNLQESEDRFRNMAESSDVLIAMADETSKGIYFNKAWTDLTGKKMEDLLAFGWADLIHPNDRERWLNAYLAAFEKKAYVEGEFRIWNRTGEYRWLLAKIPPRFRADGSFAGYISSCVDITDRKNWERSLQESAFEQQSINEELGAVNEELASANEELAATNEELGAVNEELAVTNEELTEAQEILRRNERLFRSIAVNIPDSVIVVIDKEHRYVMVEGDLMDKMGYERLDYEGKHPTEIGQTARYEATKHLYDRMLAGEKFSVERKAATGENFIVHFVPLKNDAGEVDSGLVMAIDISIHKQAEEKSAKLAAIIESSDDAIISKTLESVITSWNDSAERIFGYAADEIIGETIYKLIPPNRQHEEPQILARLKSGERVEHFETKRLTKDGRLIDVSVTVSPVKDPQGNIIGLSKIARDITEKKLDETRKNDFIGMASHELKTPLTSLSAIIQVTNSKLKNSGDAFLTGAMDKANLQVKRMTGMINGFLNVSRLESGKLFIEKETFELNQLLQEIFEETRLITNTHTVTLVQKGPVTVNADRDKINSVISNFVSNAIKYSPKGKLIEIGSQINGNMVIVYVKDEGMGIKPQHLAHIFDRYYRVESDHTRHISGFGIGLYLSSEIIKRHEGEIWAESESGKGSTFYFSLPLT
jgi:PAS domain S-box-containing protein